MLYCYVMIRMVSVFVSMKRHKESGCGYGNDEIGGIAEDKERGKKKKKNG